MRVVPSRFSNWLYTFIYLFVYFDIHTLAFPKGSVWLPTDNKTEKLKITKLSIMADQQTLTIHMHTVLH